VPLGGVLGQALRLKSLPHLLGVGRPEHAAYLAFRWAGLDLLPEELLHQREHGVRDAFGHVCWLMVVEDRGLPKGRLTAAKDVTFALQRAYPEMRV
jgi:hypothetical protein